MQKVYKLTDDSDKSFGNTHWGEGVTHEAQKGKCVPCSRTAIHYYDHPLLAVLFNPIHSNFPSYHVWEAECIPVREVHDGLKGCAKKLTTIRRIESPVVTVPQRVRFAIYCALAVPQKPAFILWAERWLSGEDRSAAAAEAAKEAAEAAAEAAAGAAEWAEAAAGAAAEAAAWAAEWAAGGTAEAAAGAAAWAAEEAAKAAPKRLDFLALAQKAIEEE